MISAAHALEVYHASTLKELQEEKKLMQQQLAKDARCDNYRTLLRLIDIVINLKTSKPCQQSK